jgi:2,2-dialkylglycine decarboxylase (pyruvate)
MCAALGHNHPTITAAIKDACDTMLHAHSSHYNVKEIELASRLGAIMPRPLQKTLFGESGADANEMAMMIARKYTGGFEIASPHISFHGLSDATRAVTFSGWHAGHGHLPGGTYAIVAPYCYRCPLNQTFPSCKFACLKTSFELLDAQTTGRPAAVITEPLFSAGGVIEPPPGWLKALQEMCHQRNMLLIVDEEQTGLGKLGQMFGFQAEGVVPDIVTVAKHFGGGVGISAVTTTAAIEDKVVREGYAATHSHANDPLICAAGTASLDIIEKENVPEKARKIGAHMRLRLEAFQQRYEMVGDVRGRGQLTGIELVRDRQTKEPATDEGKAVGKFCFQQGLIFSLRRDGSVLRFVPPSTTTDDQIDAAMDLVGKALETVAPKRNMTRGSALKQ